AGVELRKQAKIESIEKASEKFVIKLRDGELFADRIILTTGSAPWGHAIAKKFGHTIVPPVPSLFTFNVPKSPLLDLSGISVEDAELTLKACKLKERGPLLLTHWGFSGPAALKLSAWGARKLFDLDYKTTLTINWLPSKSEEALFSHFLKCKKKSPQKKLISQLPTNLFERLMEGLLLDPKKPAREFSDKSLARLAAKLHGDSYPVEGKTTYKQEFVTAGGVTLKEVDFKTMESKFCPGLYFAGEILNIDGITGGFNFQNAWTTAYLAGS
ncbi:MAG: aminoacetone oxidase family FAD-binding enzyme, partial [Simkaniaceae bacterium]|nr:aminoacetone oxidase family FAD-binding enzyme [Simkaniaceae bacterium]